MASTFSATPPEYFNTPKISINQIYIFTQDKQLFLFQLIIGKSMVSSPIHTACITFLKLLRRETEQI